MSEALVGKTIQAVRQEILHDHQDGPIVLYFTDGTSAKIDGAEIVGDAWMYDRTGDAMLVMEVYDHQIVPSTAERWDVIKGEISSCPWGGCAGCDSSKAAA